MTAATDGRRQHGDAELVRRSQVEADGIRYLEYRKGLTPRWWLVRLHIAAGYLVLVGLAVGCAATWTAAPLWFGIVTIVPFAPAIGYTIHYLHLFMHEAAHFNLASTPRRNDVLANVVIGILVGMSIGSYRPTHLNHHRNIGTPLDTEVSYFDPLNLRFVVEGLVGIKVLKAMSNHNRVPDGATPAGPAPAANSAGRWATLAVGSSILVHVVVIVLAASQGWYGLAVAWAIGAFTFYPFWGALRTLLEHRSELANHNVDYHTTNHGVVTRHFGSGPLSSTFGMAGFNRHLLHHWDPQISYTRLKDVESFLVGSEVAGPMIATGRTTYPRAFRLLYGR